MIATSTKHSGRLTVYLPVETAARELDAKLLFALFLHQKGFDVIIGSHARLHVRIHRFPPGIYVAHLFDRKKRRLFRILNRLGHLIVAWDEEGLVWGSAENYRRRRADAEALSRVRRVYAWGRQQAAALAPVTGPLGVDVCISGNPRQDLYGRPLRRMHAPVAERLRERFGDFILINSNFGWLNHARDPHPRMEKSEQGLREIARKSRHPLGYIRFRYAIFRHFCTLVPALAERFPERRIIIRPHPSENPEVWRRVAAGLGNVEVRYDHDLVPWLMAAGRIIHNGCTTAVEAALLERIAIEYRPEENAEFENLQPKAVSAGARTIGEVTELIERPGRLERMRPRVEAALSEMVERWNEGFASERIAGDLAALAARSPAPGRFTSYLWGQVLSRLRAAEKAFMARFVPSSSANPDYIRRKFPDITVDEVNERLHMLARTLDLAAPRAVRVEKNIWHLQTGE